MIEKTKKRKKCKITEDDVSSLLQRYTVATVLALLEEVAGFVGGGAKIDWEALTKESRTGISNAREYQMLWRHLAYRHSLFNQLKDGALPLDDDSDLECEVEALPDVSSEASAEASACVKVLMASGSLNDPSHPNNTVEAPLTINIPTNLSFRPALESSQSAPMRGMNIRVPVSVQKQPLSASAAGEGLDVNGSAGSIYPPRKKRKNWSEEEDRELIAAVNKFGEGNWANIVRGEFKWERTSTQLSQRWSKIRKKPGNWTSAANPTGVQLSEAQRAARHAMNLALDPPVKSSITNNYGGTNLENALNPDPPISTTEALPARPQSPELSSVIKPSSMETIKPRLALVETSVKSDLNSDPVKAAAIAAGARIATQSDAASLLKAAQSKNAIRIVTGGSSIRTSMTGTAPIHSEGHPRVLINSAGTPTAPFLTHEAGLEKGSLPVTQPSPSTLAVLNVSSEHSVTGKDTNITEGMESSKLDDMHHMQFNDARSCTLGDGVVEEVQRNEINSPFQGDALGSKVPVVRNDTSNHPEMNNGKVSLVADDDKIMVLLAKEDKNQSAPLEDGRDQGMSSELAVTPSIQNDETSEKLVVVINAEVSNGLLES